MKKAKDKGEMKKMQKRERKDKKEKENEKNEDGKKAALEMLIPNNEEDDELGWTKVGAGGAVPGDDSDHDNVLAGNDEMEGEEDEAANRRFLSQMAKSEKGEARFLHRSDHLNLDAPIAELLAGKEDDGETAKEIGMDVLFKGLPQTKKNKNLKKALTVKAEDSKKGKKGKKGKGGEEEDEEQTKAAKADLRLPAPLTTPQQERVERQAVYAKAKSDVSLWDPVVHSRRAAEHLQFPLPAQRPDMRLATAKEHTAGFRPRNPMEEQIAALLHGSKSTVRSGEELSAREESALANMTLAEAEEGRRQLMRMRVLQSYQADKLKRQNKIKSKKYRKLLRKTREKEKERELEEMKRTNPELALEEMERLEKIRMVERATLKHRNSSKYLQMQSRRAKGGDKDSQRVVNEEIEKHRALLSKADMAKSVGDNQEDEEQNDEDELEGVVEEGQEDSDNPWITVNKKKGPSVAKGKRDEEGASLQEFQKDFKQFWQKQNEEKQRERARKAEEEDELVRERLEMAGTMDDLFCEYEQISKAKLKAKKRRLEGAESEDEEDEAAAVENPEEEAEALKMATDADAGHGTTGTGNKEDARKKKEKEKSLNPDEFVRTTNLSKAELNSGEGGEIVGDDCGIDEDDDDEDQSKAIAEAFAEDDVLAADFKSEKRAAVDAEKPKDLDTFLDGWGTWGGEGIKISKRKRRRFIVKAPPAPKRRDENKGNLIINDHKQTSVSKHQMSTVPFPFNSVAAVESSMRMPIGETFIPRNASKKLTRPRMKTAVGEMIEPMSKEELVRRNIVEPAAVKIV